MHTSWNAVKTVGRYQWCLLAPYAMVVIFCHWANMGILVVVPKLRFRCMDYSPAFRNLSVDDQLRLMPENQCQRPVLDGALTSEQLRQSNRTDFLMAECEHFVYDHQYFDFTGTEQFDLVCGRSWLIPLSKTMYMIAFFCAAIGSGTISDRFGRKTATISACLVGFVGNMLSAYSPYLGLFLFSRLLVGAGDIGSYTCGLVLTTELLRRDQRIIPKVIASTIGCVGTSLIGVAALLLRDSRYFQTLTAMGFLLGAVLFWFLSVESPRWLAAGNRHEDAQEVVRYIAEVNRLTEQDLEHLHQVRDEDKAGGKATILDLFRTPLIRKRTFIGTFMWFSLIFVYYALTYNLGSFYTDVRLSLLISGVLEMPSIFIAIFTIDWMGRPCASFVFMILAGLCCFLMIPFITQAGSAALLSLALIGKMMAGNQFFIVYVSTQEIFPTVVRNMGLGCCSSVARIAGMLAPQIVLLDAYWPATTVLILGVFGVVGGIIAPFLPDTTGIELAQTIQDGENFIPDHRFSLRWPNKERINQINSRQSSRKNGGQELLTSINQDKSSKP